MERLGLDVRYALRRLLKKPVFTLVAAVSLALGIGANTAIFTLVNAVLLRDLPLDRPQELVDVYRSVAGFSHATFSYPDYRDLKADASEVFTDVGASRLALVPIDAEGQIEVVPAELVTGNWFSLLGVPAEYGRMIQPDDDVAKGGHPVVVLGYEFWQRRFGGDPEAVGANLPLYGRDYRVIGVAPKAYSGNLRGLNPSFYAPMMMIGHLQPADQDELEARGNQSIFLKARLASGVSVSQAQGAATRWAAGFRETYPGEWQADNEITLVPTSDVIMNPMLDRFIQAAAILMLTVVALVLLIACANLGSFLLAQAADRRKEIAIRLAMGAQRSQLVRQLLTESLLLSLAGGALGIGLAVLSLRALQAADLPLPLPITLDLAPDARVLLFTLAVSVVAAVMFGLAPALQGSRPDVAPTLKDESTGGGRPRRVNLRSMLVISQVAVSLALLVGAGLFLRSLQARLAVDPGFGYDPAAVLTMQLPPERYSEEQGSAFMQEYVARVAALPGVSAVGLTDDLHLSTLNNSMTGVGIDGVEPPPGQDYHLIDRAIVDPGFFAATGVRIVRGRNFDLSDEAGGPRVAIVSQAMAERFWPGQDPIGRIMRGRDTETTVIGVASDAKVRSLGEDPRPFIYQPYSQSYRSGVTVVARTDGGDERTLLSMSELLRTMDPEAIVFEQKTMARHLETMMVGHRLGAWVISAFGVLALFLATLGLYGVVSYAVATRSREVGIRLSLGAEPAQVIRMLMRGGMRLVGIGLVLGFALALLGSRLASGLLYGVSVTDPVAFAVVPLLLAAVAALAAWIPARRAGRVSPVRALRANG
ncbi:MAG: ABC transporter permease [Gemmatimonadota bacterium]